MAGSGDARQIVQTPTPRFLPSSLPTLRSCDGPMTEPGSSGTRGLANPCRPRGEASAQASGAPFESPSCSPQPRHNSSTTYAASSQGVSSCGAHSGIERRDDFGLRPRPRTGLGGHLRLSARAPTCGSQLPRRLQPLRRRLDGRRVRERRIGQAAHRGDHRQAAARPTAAHPPRRPRHLHALQARRPAPRGSRRHQDPQPASHLERQRLLGEPVQDAEVPPRLPEAPRRPGGRQDLLRALSAGTTTTITTTASPC